MINLNNFNKKNNIFYLTKEEPESSKIYITVRKKEKRILSDIEVKKLPYLKRDEWPLRIKSTERFESYIASKKRGLQILTIGCGNGWFSNRIATVSKDNQVIGLDVNREELEQAANVFSKNNLHFVYADIFKVNEQFISQFDIIILNGAVQYFEDFKVLISVLKLFLKPKGEIHIIDSPFYNVIEIPAAKKRTKTYYSELGVPEMANHYFHHDESLLSDFSILYSYKWNIIHKVLGKKESPFSWYCYIKN
ncbi:class I SAM-dependent methyltransferase [Aquimarina sp. M1]